MREQYINIRVQSVSTEKNAELIRHCLRSKKEIRAINDNDNIILLSNGDRVLFKRNDYLNPENINMKLTTQILLDNQKLLEKQKAILKKNDKYLNAKRTNQALSGVLTFSDSILGKTETELLEIEGAAQKTLNEICKKYNTKLHYLVFHKDEKGLHHFHFTVDNFDNDTGLTFSKSKNFGSELQDIAASHFSQLGFNRGIKKDKNHNRKHLSIREYEEYKDTKKANQRLREQNNALIREKETTLQEFMEIISDIEEFAIEEDKSKKTKKWVNLWERYFNSDNIEKRANLVKKARYTRDKLNRKQSVKSEA